MLNHNSILCDNNNISEYFLPPFNNFNYHMILLIIVACLHQNLLCIHNYYTGFRTLKLEVNKLASTVAICCEHKTMQQFNSSGVKLTSI